VSGKELFAPFTANFVSSQKRGETSRRFERLNQFFEETFGTVCSYPQNIEKLQEIQPLAGFEDED
jgi:hypothetical protein